MKGFKFMLWLSIICTVVTVVFLFIDTSVFITALVVTIAEWGCFYFFCYLPAKAKADSIAKSKQASWDSLVEKMDEQADDADETVDEEDA